MISRIFKPVDAIIFKVSRKLVPGPALHLAAGGAGADDLATARPARFAKREPEGWITRNWRPCFMFLAMLILALYGIILPFLNLMLGVPLGFAPLWEEVPAGIWELLKWTAGVYAGGRTLEKVAAIVSRRTAFMGGAHRRPADGGRASPVNPPSDSV